MIDLRERLAGIEDRQDSALSVLGTQVLSMASAREARKRRAERCGQQ